MTPEHPVSISDATECYAVPGRNNMIDVINPVTGLSWCYGHTAEQVTEREPAAVRMSVAEFAKAKGERQYAALAWIPTSAAKYREMLEVLPPAMWDGGYFLVGEPYDHCALTGQARYQAYRAIGGRHYAASRPMSRPELTAWMQGKAAHRAYLTRILA